MAEDASRAGVQTSGNTVNIEEEQVRREEVKLRRLLRFHRYTPIKWKNGKCHIQFCYCLVMILQLVKIGLITSQMIIFADARSTFSLAVNKGHLTLRHLLLKNWDSGMETPPYPPAHGDFAMYNIKDLLEEMNYAVEAYYNIENDAIGFYKLYDNGDHIDDMVIRMKYFDFPGFDDLKIDSGLAVKDREIQVRNEIGLTTAVDPKTNRTTYKYNITEAFEVMNLTEPVKRLLSIDLVFSLHSVRVYEKSKSAVCLYIEGTVSFRDEDNNGQMLVDLVTLSAKKPCSDINISVQDLNTGCKTLGIIVIVICCLSSIFGFGWIGFGLYLFVRTNRFMKKNYKYFYEDDKGTNLSTNEWVKYFSFLIRDIFIFISDGCTIAGTTLIAFSAENSDATLSQFDIPAIALSIGGLFSWIYILQIFKIHHYFFILFKILSAAFFPMLAYLICISVLFIGFFLCGYVVLGPYHVKFATVSTTMETLFSIGNGDEIFATFANVEDKKSGTEAVLWFSRVYLCAYVAIFTVVVLNILIAIFVGAQDIIKDERQKRNEKLKFGSLEKALDNLLTKKRSESLRLMSALTSTPEYVGNASPEIMKVKAELEKLWKITGEGDSKTISKLVEPTLKAFIEGKYPDSSEGCC